MCDTNSSLDPEILELVLGWNILISFGERSDIAGTLEGRQLLSHGMHMLGVRREHELGPLGS